MKKNPNPIKRKCVNLIEKDFDVIKKFCDENSLDMPRWIGNVLVGIINNSQSVPLINYTSPLVRLGLQVNKEPTPPVHTPTTSPLTVIKAVSEKESVVQSSPL